MVLWYDNPKGLAVFVDLIAFDSVEVDGKSGGLELYISGEGTIGEWDGNWTIVNASGELEGLSGHGKWWGPGFLGEGCGETFYSVEELEEGE